MDACGRRQQRRAGTLVLTLLRGCAGRPTMTPTDDRASIRGVETIEAQLTGEPGRQRITLELLGRRLTLELLERY